MQASTTELIDVHSHFVTAPYIAAAKAAGAVNPDGMPGYPGWDVESHLELMEAGGIGTSILSLSSPGTHFGDDRAARVLTRQVNEFAAGLASSHTGCFGHFASLPLPDVEGSLAELAYALDTLGSDGVAVETNTHGVYLGAEAYEPLWAQLHDRRAVVFVHPTSPPCWQHTALGRPRPMLEFVFDSTRAVADLLFSGVLARYPGIDWVFTHGGGTLPLMADRMELFRTIFADADPGFDAQGPSVPDQVGRLWFDMAGTPFPRQIPALVKAFGAQRLLYGSDYCWTPVSGALAQIASIDAAEQPSADTWRSLTTRNARKLLPLRGSGA